jgi:hypothetical protein
MILLAILWWIVVGPVLVIAVCMGWLWLIAATIKSLLQR